MAQYLKYDKTFVPCPEAEGDELYRNGIFIFNITKLTQHLESDESNVELTEIEVAHYAKGFSSIDKTHVQTTDTTKPVIIAEIAPNRYNLIDGNHRAEKAKAAGIATLPCYKVTVTEHLPFLTSTKAYTAYVEYWNDKVSQYG